MSRVEPEFGRMYELRLRVVEIANLYVDQNNLDPWGGYAHIWFPKRGFVIWYGEKGMEFQEGNRIVGVSQMELAKELKTINRPGLIRKGEYTGKKRVKLRHFGDVSVTVEIQDEKNLENLISKLARKVPSRHKIKGLDVRETHDEVYVYAIYGK